MRWARRSTVGAVLASFGLVAFLAAFASAKAAAGANVLAGSPFQAIVGAKCLRSPLDRVAIPVCYTASASATIQVVMTRKEYESIGGVGWGGTTGLSAAAGPCKGGSLVTCPGFVSVTRPELLMIVPGRQKNPMYLTAMAYVYMDVAQPPVPTEPLHLTPPAGTTYFLMEAMAKGGPPEPESGWISTILLIHRVEGLPPFRLPANFYRLDSADQLFVLINLERTTRGLVPYFGLSAPSGLQAALEGHGLHLPPGSLDIAEAGVSDPARAVFQWLYNGLSQPMPSCSRADPAACPVAEDVILQHHDGLAGMFEPLAVYVANPGQGGSAVRLEVGAAARGTTPSAPAAGPLVYTWAEAVAEGARPAR